MGGRGDGGASSCPFLDPSPNIWGGVPHVTPYINPPRGGTFEYTVKILQIVEMPGGRATGGLAIFIAFILLSVLTLTLH